MNVVEAQRSRLSRVPSRVRLRTARAPLGSCLTRPSRLSAATGREQMIRSEKADSAVNHLSCLCVAADQQLTSSLTQPKEVIRWK
jgi:hypothetical protein